MELNNIADPKEEAKKIQHHKRQSGNILYDK
jgi:hypothetical protein